MATAFERVQTRFESMIAAFIEGSFQRLVRSILRHRRVTTALAIVALIVSIATAMGGHLPFSLLLAYEGDRVVVQVTLPPGSEAATTRSLLSEIEHNATLLKAELEEQHSETVVRGVLEAMGGHPSSGASLTSVSEPSGSHLGEVIIQLTPGENRPVSTGEVASLLRSATTASIPSGARIEFITERTAPDPDIDIRFVSQDIDHLRGLVASLRAELTRYPGVHEINDTLTLGKDEYDVSVTPEGEALGISLRDVGKQLRQAFYGEEVQRIQRGEDDIRLMVRYTETERRRLDSLANMRVRTSDGGEVPFADVTELRLRQGLSTIYRTDGFRSANVTARVDSSYASAGAVLEKLETEFLGNAVSNYPGAAYHIDSLREREDLLASVLPLLLLALFAIYALISIPLKSYTQTLIVLAVIPFVWVGAILGHVLLKLTGHVEGLSMPSIFGIVAASGVAVNATLVLLHAYNERRVAGDAHEEGLVSAAMSRFRPILITSITTFAGLAPLMFSRSVAAQSLVPLAVSLAFGIVVAAFAALLVVPAFWINRAENSRVAESPSAEELDLA